MKWKIINRKYSSGYALFLGSVRVGSVFYDATNTQETPEKYKAFCTLPITPNSARFVSEDIAKSAVESAVQEWLASAGLVEA